MNLSHLDQAWEETPVTPSKGSGNETPLPPGKYLCHVDSADVFESKDGRPFLKILMVVDEGDHKGQMFTKLYKLDDVERMKFIKQDLDRLGFHIQKISQISEILVKLQNVQQNVAAVQKGEYTNYYFNGKPSVKQQTNENVPF
jgi:hypothetical protein